MIRMSMWKRIMILLIFIGSFIFVFTAIKGIVRIISLFVLFPLFFFYCPLLFAGEKEEEKTPEAKREEEGKFYKWQ